MSDGPYFIVTDMVCPLKFCKVDRENSQTGFQETKLGKEVCS